jgi:murein peptide amidase A
MRIVFMCLLGLLCGCGSSGVGGPEVRMASMVETQTLGYSVKGAPIGMQRFDPPVATAAAPALIFAGIHGDEPRSIDLAKQFAAFLESNPHALKRAVVVVPMLNPDGFELNRRTNARGVDLNRNLPASNWQASQRGKYFNGTEPLSEPESRLLHDLVVDLKPAVVVSIHSIRRGRHGNNFDGPANDLAKAMAKINRYPVLESMGYPTPGSFGSWAGVDRKIPTITLELPHNIEPAAAWNDNRDALMTAVNSHLAP